MTLGTLSSLKKFQVRTLPLPPAVDTIMPRYGTVVTTERPTTVVTARATGVSRPRSRRVLIVKVKSKFVQRMLRIA